MSELTKWSYLCIYLNNKIDGKQTSDSKGFKGTESVKMDITFKIDFIAYRR